MTKSFQPKFNLGDIVCIDLHIDVYFGFIKDETNPVIKTLAKKNTLPILKK